MTSAEINIDDFWRSEIYRSIIVDRIEEAANSSSGVPLPISIDSVEIEKDIFSRSTSKDDYVKEIQRVITSLKNIQAKCSQSEQAVSSNSLVRSTNPSNIVATTVESVSSDMTTNTGIRNHGLPRIADANTASNQIEAAMSPQGSSGLLRGDPGISSAMPRAPLHSGSVPQGDSSVANLRPGDRITLEFPTAKNNGAAAQSVSLAQPVACNPQLAAHLLNTSPYAAAQMYSPLTTLRPLLPSLPSPVYQHSPGFLTGQQQQQQLQMPISSVVPSSYSSYYSRPASLASIMSQQQAEMAAANRLNSQLMPSAAMLPSVNLPPAFVSANPAPSFPGFNVTMLRQLLENGSPGIPGSGPGQQCSPGQGPGGRPGPGQASQCSPVVVSVESLAVSGQQSSGLASVGGQNGTVEERLQMARCDAEPQFSGEASVNHANDNSLAVSDTITPPARRVQELTRLTATMRNPALITDVPIKCIRCYADIPSSLLLDHIATHHLNFARWRCGVCDFRSVSRQDALEHRTTVGHNRVPLVDLAENKSLPVSRVLHFERGICCLAAKDPERAAAILDGQIAWAIEQLGDESRDFFEAESNAAITDSLDNREREVAMQENEDETSSTETNLLARLQSAPALVEQIVVSSSQVIRNVQAADSTTDKPFVPEACEVCLNRGVEVIVSSNHERIAHIAVHARGDKGLQKEHMRAADYFKQLAVVAVECFPFSNSNLVKGAAKSVAAQQAEAAASNEQQPQAQQQQLQPEEVPSTSNSKKPVRKKPTELVRLMASTAGDFPLPSRSTSATPTSDDGSASFRPDESDQESDESEEDTLEEETEAIDDDEYVPSPIVRRRTASGRSEGGPPPRKSRRSAAANQQKQGRGSARNSPGAIQPRASRVGGGGGDRRSSSSTRKSDRTRKVSVDSGRSSSNAGYHHQGNNGGGGRELRPRNVQRGPNVLASAFDPDVFDTEDATAQRELAEQAKSKKAAAAKNSGKAPPAKRRKGSAYAQQTQIEKQLGVQQGFLSSKVVDGCLGDFNPLEANNDAWLNRGASATPSNSAVAKSNQSRDTSRESSMVAPSLSQRSSTDSPSALAAGVREMITEGSNEEQQPRRVMTRQLARAQEQGTSTAKNGRNQRKSSAAGAAPPGGKRRSADGVECYTVDSDEEEGERCTFCNKKFTDLLDHVIWHLEEERERLYVCSLSRLEPPVCKYLGSSHSIAAVNKHIQKSHNGGASVIDRRRELRPKIRELFEMGFPTVDCTEELLSGVEQKDEGVSSVPVQVAPSRAAPGSAECWLPGVDIIGRVECMKCNTWVINGRKTKRDHIYQSHCGQLPAVCKLCGFRGLDLPEVMTHVKAEHPEHKFDSNNSVAIMDPDVERTYSEVQPVCFPKVPPPPYAPEEDIPTTSKRTFRDDPADEIINLDSDDETESPTKAKSPDKLSQMPTASNKSQKSPEKFPARQLEAMPGNLFDLPGIRVTPSVPLVSATISSSQISPRTIRIEATASRDAHHPMSDELTSSDIVNQSFTSMPALSPIAGAEPLGGQNFFSAMEAFQAASRDANYPISDMLASSDVIVGFEATSHDVGHPISDELASTDVILGFQPISVSCSPEPVANDPLLQQCETPMDTNEFDPQLTADRSFDAEMTMLNSASSSHGCASGGFATPLIGQNDQEALSEIMMESSFACASTPPADSAVSSVGATNNEDDERLDQIENEAGMFMSPAMMPSTFSNPSADLVAPSLPPEQLVDFPPGPAEAFPVDCPPGPAEAFPVDFPPGPAEAFPVDFPPGPAEAFPVDVPPGPADFFPPRAAVFPPRPEESGDDDVVLIEEPNWAAPGAASSSDAPVDGIRVEPASIRIGSLRLTVLQPVCFYEGYLAITFAAVDKCVRAAADMPETQIGIPYSSIISIKYCQEDPFTLFLRLKATTPKNKDIARCVRIAFGMHMCLEAGMPYFDSSSPNPQHRYITIRFKDDPSAPISRAFPQILSILRVVLGRLDPATEAMFNFRLTALTPEKALRLANAIIAPLPPGALPGGGQTPAHGPSLSAAVEQGSTPAEDHDDAASYTFCVGLVSVRFGTFRTQEKPGKFEMDRDALSVDLIEKKKEIPGGGILTEGIMPWLRVEEVEEISYYVAQDQGHSHALKSMLFVKVGPFQAERLKKQILEKYDRLSDANRVAIERFDPQSESMHHKYVTILLDYISRVEMAKLWNFIDYYALNHKHIKLAALSPKEAKAMSIETDPNSIVVTVMPAAAGLNRLARARVVFPNSASSVRNSAFPSPTSSTAANGAAPASSQPIVCIDLDSEPEEGEITAEMDEEPEIIRVIAAREEAGPSAPPAVCENEVGTLPTQRFGHPEEQHASATEASVTSANLVDRPTSVSESTAEGEYILAIVKSEADSEQESVRELLDEMTATIASPDKMTATIEIPTGTSANAAKAAESKTTEAKSQAAICPASSVKATQPGQTTEAAFVDPPTEHHRKWDASSVEGFHGNAYVTFAEDLDNESASSAFDFHGFEPEPPLPFAGSPSSLCNVSPLNSPAREASEENFDGYHYGETNGSDPASAFGVADEEIGGDNETIGEMEDLNNFANEEQAASAMQDFNQEQSVGLSVSMETSESGVKESCDGSGQKNDDVIADLVGHLLDQITN